MNKPIGKKNIVYETNAISNYFSQNRIAFKDFYKSEKNVLEKINWFDGIKILDVGCGCGGLVDVVLAVVVDVVVLWCVFGCCYCVCGCGCGCCGCC